MSGYDLSITTYTPDGKLMQLEYAQKAVDASGTAIGLRCKDGCILAVERYQTSKMLKKNSGRKLHIIDTHIAMATAGILADGRRVVNRAVEEADGWKQNYGQPIPPKVLAQRVATYLHLYTTYWFLRPFAASVVIAGYDAETGEHELWKAGLDGTVARYFGCAVGRGTRVASTEIETAHVTEKTVDEVLSTAAKVLHIVQDSQKDKTVDVQMMRLSAGTQWRVQRLPEAELQSALEAGRAAADAAGEAAAGALPGAAAGDVEEDMEA